MIVLTVHYFFSLRVTPDKRVSVLHDDGGHVFVLSIANLTLSDSGVYVCEINTDPPTRAFHNLTVLKKKDNSTDASAKSDSEDKTKEEGAGYYFSTERPVPRHDFTQCCRLANVSRKCIGFCDVEKVTCFPMSTFGAKISIILHRSLAARPG